MGGCGGGRRGGSVGGSGVAIYGIRVERQDGQVMERDGGTVPHDLREFPEGMTFVDETFTRFSNESFFFIF